MTTARSLHNPSSKLTFVMFFYSSLLFFSEVFLTKVLSYLHILPRPLDVLPLVLIGLAIGSLFAHFLLKNKFDLFTKAIIHSPFFAVLPFVGMIITNNSFFIISLHLPFYICIGFIIATCFLLGPTKKMYFYDLCGSMLGCLIAIYFVTRLGGESTFLLFLIFATTSSIYLYPEKKFSKFLWAYTLLLFVGLFLHLKNDSLNLVRNLNKFEFSTPTSPQAPYTMANEFLRRADSQLVATRWSNTLRIDIIKSKFRPWFNKSYNNFSYSVFFDNALFSEIPQPWWESTPDKLKSPKVYFLSKEYKKILLIGIGPAPELASYAPDKSVQITGIEINEAISDLMLGPFKAISNNVYDRLHSLHVSDARSYLYNSSERFDVIDLSAVLSNIPSASSTVNLDDYLFTKEAIVEYFNHLTAHGLFVTQMSYREDRVKVYRLLNLVSQTMRSLGMSPQNHLLIYTETTPSTWGNLSSFFILKMSPWSAKDLAIYDHTIRSSNGKYTYILRPNTNNSSLSDQHIISDLLAGKNIEQHELFFSQKYNADISPPTDNKPFFGLMYAGMTNTVWIVITSLFLCLFVVFTMALCLPKIAAQTRPLLFEHSSALIACALLGAGYSLQQIVWYNYFNLPLGLPTVTFIAVVIGILTGSTLSCIKSVRYTQFYSIIFLIGAVFYSLFLLKFGKIYLNKIPGDFLKTRALISAVSLIPIGFLISFPFPRIIHKLNMSTLPLGAIGYSINSLMIVIFYGLGTHLTFLYGFESLKAIMICLYLISLPFVFASLKKQCSGDFSEY